MDTLTPALSKKYHQPTLLFPLVNGVSGRVAVVRPEQQGKPTIQTEENTRYVSRVVALKGAGNAIVPQVAAEVIKAFMSSQTTTGV